MHCPTGLPRFHPNCDLTNLFDGVLSTFSSLAYGFASIIPGESRTDVASLAMTKVANIPDTRHLIISAGVTLEGQKKLKAASILRIGAGGLGSPIALYLAADRDWSYG